MGMGRQETNMENRRGDIRIDRKFYDRIIYLVSEHRLRISRFSFVTMLAQHSDSTVENLNNLTDLA